MLISFKKVKRLAIVTAVIVIPIICINLLNLSPNDHSKPVNKEIKTIEQIKMPINQTLATQVDEGIGFFSEFRIEKERVRGKQLELLKDIANNPNQDQKVRDSAALKLVQIADTMAREMQTETLIKSKGYKECAVMIESAGLTIILNTQVISKEQKDELYALSSTASGIEKEKIMITSRQKYR